MEKQPKIVYSYFLDKATGNDFTQLEALPKKTLYTFFHGTDEECVKALSDIRAEESSQNKKILGEAALEYIRDVRALNENDLKVD